MREQYIHFLAPIFLPIIIACSHFLHPLRKRAIRQIDQIKNTIVAHHIISPISAYPKAVLPASQPNI